MSLTDIALFCLAWLAVSILAGLVFGLALGPASNHSRSRLYQARDEGSYGDHAAVPGDFPTPHSEGSKK